MRRQTLVTLLCLGLVIALGISASAASLGGMVLKGAAVGFLVTKTAEPLDKFINTITLKNHVPTNLDTKVVPVLSVGEKGYIGGAQVSGPKVQVDKVKAVFQYENNFSNNEYRIKVLVPSSSLNPLKLERVDKVGLSALIDVSLSGGLHNQTAGYAMRADDVLKAGAIAVAIKNFAPQMNSVINKITFNKGYANKVTPMASFGDKAYIGGAQVTGSNTVINGVNAVWQYEGIFSSGKFRVKALVPTTSSNPLKMKRVNGAGITAVIDASLKDQYDPDKNRYAGSRYAPWDPRRGDTDEDRDYRDARVNKKDNGKHKGWTIGKHKGWYKNGKIYDPKWQDRREDLDDRDKVEFDKWLGSQKSSKDSDLERAWREFQSKLLKN